MKFTPLGRLTTLAFVGTLALSACGSDDNDDTPPPAAAPAASAATSGGASASTDAAPACPSGTLSAEGSSAQDNAMQEWIKAFQAKCSGITVNYNPTGSGAGVTSFTGGKVSFAGSDSALKPEEQGPADARCKTGKAINLPMVVGPIAVAYNLDGVDNLQLSAATTAKIFANKITKWDDPAIKAENPDAKLPSSPIQTIHRSDSSGTTDNFTKWLAAAAASDWTYANAKEWKAPGGQGAAKSSGVATAIKGGQGTVGYIESSFAENSQLGVAKIANDGKNFVELSTEAAGKAISAAKRTGTGNDYALKLDYATTAEGAYPLVLVTYEITCEKGLPADQLAATQAFLTYTVSPEGQKVLSDNGYASLPDELRTQVETAVKALA